MSTPRISRLLHSSLLKSNEALAVTVVLIALQVLSPRPATAQVVLTGRVLAPRFPGAESELPQSSGLAEDYFAPGRKPLGPNVFPLSNVRCFASLVGSGSEALGFRTWEQDPSGWYRMSGSAGSYTLLFTGPSHFIRPAIFNNIFVDDGQTIDRKVSPRFDHAVFHAGDHDGKPASRYFQTFVARGKAVTGVGFKLAHDGVDGMGPGSQTLLVSIHRRNPGTPDTWEQVGPAVPVVDVDCGGPKNPEWTAAWNSGEVPLVPGETYAVQLKSESPSGTFQAFWRPDGDSSADCWRTGPQGSTGFQGRDLWLAVGTDGDGLLIPYNKRVQKEYGQFAGFARKWSQTYVARGRSLAGVVLCAATGGTQPGLHRQRAAVRVREGGPQGPVVGVEKIAIGNGLYTGDASWGTFGAALAPGEVPLTPGKTYAVEIESIENHESLHGFVNIKGDASDERPGFNPYRKHPSDPYEPGAAYKSGVEDAGFDLDMQILEYEHEGKDWAQALDSRNLLPNGDMEALETIGQAIGQGGAGGGTAGALPKAWKTFSVEPETIHCVWADGPDKKNHVLRVAGSAAGAKAVSGGFVQKVEGLSYLETYRLSGLVRSSWPLDAEHASCVGYDPTGQDSDPEAKSIVWTKLPPVHSAFVSYRSPPIRTRAGAISVWLRGWAKSAAGFPFRADFDDFALRRVDTGIPGRKEAAVDAPPHGHGFSGDPAK
jgi:hypothetical protein